jgi:putative transposase
VHGIRSGHTRPRTSLLAALIDNKLTAPMLFEGTCNAVIFNAWIEHMLAPHLDENCVVVMDNAAFHKSIKTRQLIYKTKARLLFLPPYSPDFNPIEQTFGTLKRKRSYQPDISIDDLIKVYG